MMSRADKGWRVVRAARLRYRRFGDESVLYDDASGNTHLLDDVAGAVLEQLLDGSATFDELIASVAGDDAGPEACEHVRRVLDHLRKLGVAKPLRK